MRKLQFWAVVWTLALAIPLSVLALVLLAYTTEHLIAISTAIARFSQMTTAGGRGWILEFAQRWPEVAGMIIGQLVLLTLLFFARQADNNKDSAEQKATKTK